MERLRIFGAGVRASIVVDLIAWQFGDRVEVEGYYDDRLQRGALGPGGCPVLGRVDDGLKELPGTDCKAFVALGTRASGMGCQIFLNLRAQGVSLLSFISPTAHVSPSAEIGANSLVLPGVFVGHQVKIGHLLCAHGGSVVEHHSRIGHNVLLGPGTAIAGNAKVGSHSFIATGCTVSPDMTVGPGTLLGAGSVVIRDIPPHVVAFGQPAVPVRGVTVNDQVPTETEVRMLSQLGLE